MFYRFELTSPVFRKQQNFCNWPKKRTMSVSAVLSLLANLALNSLLLLQSRGNIVESNCCTVELSWTQFWELKSTESVSFDTETVSFPSMKEAFVFHSAKYTVWTAQHFRLHVICAEKHRASWTHAGPAPLPAVAMALLSSCIQSNYSFLFKLCTSLIPGLSLLNTFYLQLSLKSLKIIQLCL